MVKTAKQRPAKTREIVTIAETLFLEKGYTETTIDDILDKTGLSKGGFYHYFNSKEEVLSECINILMDDMLTALKPIIEDEQLTALQKLRLFMKKKAEFQHPRREFAKHLSMLMKSDFTLYKYYLSLAQNYVEPFTTIIEQGKKEGSFSVQYPRETADILIRAVTSFPQSALLGEYMQEEKKIQKYSNSLKQVIARTLGIDPKELEA
jgi:AcrR family transcriptional regulator